MSPPTSWPTGPPEVRPAPGLLRRAVARARALGSRPTAGRAGGPGFTLGYAPKRDGRADPGEVVWAWVPFEEDASQGKDRPVLVVGRDGADLIALMLTSKDHDARAAHDAALGTRWMDIGTGGWDRLRRPSEVRLDRVLRLRADAVRREGAALDRRRFDAVVEAANALHGWRGVASSPPPAR